MSKGWIVFWVVVVAAFLLLWESATPIVLEGKVIERNIAKNSKDDSFITIQTPTKEKIVLKFQTREVDILIQWGGESFHGKVKKLDRAISMGDVIRVETFDTDGITRNVYRLLSVRADP